MSTECTYDTWNFSGDLFCNAAGTGVKTQLGNTSNPYASYLDNFLEGRKYETRRTFLVLLRTRDLTVQNYGSDSVNCGFLDMRPRMLLVDPSLTDAPQTSCDLI